MTADEKLDLIIEKLEENQRLLRSILEKVEADTPTREFLLNLGADMLGNVLSGGR